jgi:type IV secretory pathway VirB9-like protein
MKRLLNSLIILLLLGASVQAEEIPTGSSFDKRIRSAVYNPDEVYRVAARIGYASYLQLWEGEKLESYFTGDASGWDVGSHGSIVAFKPLVKNPTTNFIIVSSKGRVYNLIFDLKTKITKGHVIGLRFGYPDEEREKLQEKKAAQREVYLQKKREQDIQRKAQNIEQLKAERLLASEFSLQLEKLELKREADQAKAEKKQKIARLESELRRRALKQEKHDEKLALLSMQEQLFSFNQVKREAAYQERKRQRDEAMQQARQEQEALDRAEARLEAKRLRLKRLKNEAEEALEKRKAKLALEKKQAQIDPHRQAYKNYNYSAAGAGSLRPIKMFDNGRFTFIKFEENKPLPAVFRVRNGMETLVNSNMKSGWMIIQNLSNEWKVRLDDEYICIKKMAEVSA